MLILRPSRPDDLESLLAMSRQIGNGMTSMPDCRSTWQAKLAASELAFNSPADASASHCYFMVLEDLTSGALAGTTAIYTGIGQHSPMYWFEVSDKQLSSQRLNKSAKLTSLTLSQHYQGSTEVGSLFLLPEYRLPGIGQLLARARYLLMAQFPERFGDRVMAELRGYQDSQGESPLWNALGSQFFEMPFQQAVETVARQGAEFVEELLPSQPLYTQLLPQSAREVIGRPNDASAPALHMLKKEGFQFTGFVDVFDGGPSVHCQRDEIASIRHSRRTRVSEQTLPESAEAYLVCNEQLSGFRAMLTPAVEQHGGLAIDSASASALGVTAKTSIRYVALKSAKRQAA